MPLPWKLESTPPLTLTSAWVKSVLASLKVKVTVAVALAAKVVVLAVIAMVGAVVSLGAGLVRVS